MVVKIINYNADLLIDNVAKLRLTEPHYNNQVVTILGHTTAGVGGGEFYADLTDTTTADDNGLTIVTSGGKRWKRITASLIDSDMFGGDVRKLLPNAQTKYVIKLMSDYYIDSALSLNKNDITIDFNGFSIIPTVNNISGLTISGSGQIGSYVNLTSNMLKGSNIFSANISLQVGDFVRIISNALFEQPNENSGKYGQLFKITDKINSTTYRLDFSAHYNYFTSDNARVSKWGMIPNLILINPKFNIDNYINTFSIILYLRWVYNYEIINPDVQGSKEKYIHEEESEETLEEYRGHTGIKIKDCVRGIVKNLSAKHIGWYGLEIVGSVRDLKIYGGYAYDGRHGFSLNWLDPDDDHYGEPLLVTVNDFHADKCTHSCGDTHDRGDLITLNNCTFSNSVYDSGLQQRNKRIIINGGRAYGNALHGYVSRNKVKGSFNGTKAYNNGLQNGNGSGYYYPEGGVDGLNIDAYNNGDAGVYAAYGHLQGGDIENNQFSVRIPYVEGVTAMFTMSGVYAPVLAGGKNQIFVEDCINYSLNRLYLKSNLLFLADGVLSPIIANPETDKRGVLPMTDGYNKTFDPSLHPSTFFVSLVGGTKTISTNKVRKFYPSSSISVPFMNKITYDVVTPNNNSSLRHTITDGSHIVITSNSTSDTSSLAVEITGF